MSELQNEFEFTVDEEAVKAWLKNQMSTSFDFRYSYASAKATVFYRYNKNSFYWLYYNIAQLCQYSCHGSHWQHHGGWPRDADAGADEVYAPRRYCHYGEH